VAAYRDRHGITDTIALGPPPGGDAPKVDAARARAAVDRARSLADVEEPA